MAIHSPAISDFLLSLRTASPFTQHQIRRNLLIASGRSEQECQELSGSEEKRLYLEVLESMGYRLVNAPESPNQEFRQKDLLTFTTQYTHTISPANSDKFEESELDRQLTWIRQLLRTTGFGMMFHSVILTDDPILALTEILEEHAPGRERYLRWYYQLRHFRSLLDYPAGCLFYLGEARFPVLVISPSALENIFYRFEAIQMRVVHEITHYYLTFTLFLDEQVPQAEFLLELAGKSTTLFLLDLIEESFAHADTAHIIGNNYVNSLPEPLPIVDDMTPLSDDYDAVTGSWLRSRMVRVFRSLAFDAIFPWVFSLKTLGQDRKVQRLIERMQSPFPTFAWQLIEPLEMVYEKARLDTPHILQLIRAVDEDFAHLAHVITRRAFDNFVTSNLRSLIEP